MSEATTTGPAAPDEIVVAEAPGEMPGSTYAPLRVMRTAPNEILVRRNSSVAQRGNGQFMTDTQAVAIAHALLRMAGTDLWAAIEAYAEAVHMTTWSTRQFDSVEVSNARFRVRSLLGMGEEDGGE